MQKGAKHIPRRLTTLTGALTSLLGGCTSYNPDAFRYAQQFEAFSLAQNFNTKVDLLWVVDNSASMDVAQDRLRTAFTAFANTYMKPTWDIQVAVITTDTYLANAGFSTWLDTTVPGTTGWTTAYLTARMAALSNPSWNTSLFNSITGVFTKGIKYKELVPVWGGTGELYSLLKPGLHDGPTPAICSEYTPSVYFYNGATQCHERDDTANGTGTSACLNPNTGLGETAIKQCVNTLQNNTVRSGKAIISTMPPAGVVADSAWTQQLVDDFLINVTTGSSGHGSERGLGSVTQLLEDNESTATRFFRTGSLRAIIFVADEDDQTMAIPSSPPAGFAPTSLYKCDLAGLQALNPGAGIGNNGSLCCANGTCSYGSLGTSCTPKTVGTLTYTPSICPDPNELVPVTTIKSTIDAFFRGLDGDSSGDPNYFVASIVPLIDTSISTLQADRTTEDTNVGATKITATDRGDRYIAFGDAVANGSMSMDLGSSDYSPILQQIGNQIIQKRASFKLSRAPTNQEEMIVAILHSDGRVTTLRSTQYSINGATVSITDLNFILTLGTGDRITIDYQPRTAG